jgi:peptidoglycan-N-acetylglucosamine deacetylase
MILSSVALVVLLAAPPAPPAVALTFDDGSDLASINLPMLKALADAQVKSVLYIAGGNVDSPQGLALVRRWGEAGHWIGNHSYSHRSFGTAAVTLAAFQSDVLRNEMLFKDMPGWTRTFRFPFLREGETADKRDGFRAFLRKQGYRSGRPTIDASDWYYAGRFRAWKARNAGADPAPYRKAYLDHLSERVSYYEDLARKVVGRPVKHTLLLHTNEINAAFLSDVIAMLRARGWTIIDPATAYADPIYDSEPRILPAGQSLVWALAKARGIPGLRYPGESEKYEKPRLDAAGL